MALVFFQSPEEPVQCALKISRVLKNHPRLRLRIGVHSKMSMKGQTSPARELILRST
jgi:class 3 adenylate cyclase